MIPIELKKRYPHSRDEDITDAFMRGYQAHGEAVQGEWIPCSEKLPDIDCEVLASGFYDDVFIAKLKEDKKGEYYWSAFGGFPVMFASVDAWMPLPTPYKGGDDE